MRDSGFSPSDPDSLGLGLMFGNDSAFSPGFKELVKSAGVTHLVAASGANLRFVLALPGWMAGRYSWVLWQWLSLAVIWWYWRVAEQGGSLWRACLMWLTAWLSIWLGRPVNNWYCWMLAFGLTWLVDRTWLTHSFWLSSLAIFGLGISQFIISGENNNRLLTHAEKRIGSWLKSWLVGALIFLFVVGYLVWQFSSFEPIGILTTMLLEPFIPVYLVVSSVSLVIESGNSWLSRLVNWQGISMNYLKSGLAYLQTSIFMLIWYLLEGVTLSDTSSGQAVTRLVAILAVLSLLQAWRRLWRRLHQTRKWRRVVKTQLSTRGGRYV